MPHAASECQNRLSTIYRGAQQILSIMVIVSTKNEKKNDENLRVERLMMHAIYHHSFPFYLHNGGSQACVTFCSAFLSLQCMRRMKRRRNLFYNFLICTRDRLRRRWYSILLRCANVSRDTISTNSHMQETLFDYGTRAPPKQIMIIK